MEFPSSLAPLFQSESKCDTFHMKMSSACSFIFMQIKVIFMRIYIIVSHLDSLSNRDSRELGNGLLTQLEQKYFVSVDTCAVISVDPLVPFES